MSETQIRTFLERELLQSSSTSSFYWESDELEDAVELVIEAVTRLVIANNARLAADIKGNILKDAALPPGLL